MFQVDCGPEAFYVMQVPPEFSVTMLVHEEQALNVVQDRDDERVNDKRRMWQVWSVSTKERSTLVGVFESAYPCGQGARLRIVHRADWIGPLERIIESFRLRTSGPLLLPRETRDNW